MAYRRKSTSRNTSSRKRVYGKRAAPAKGYRTGSAVPAKKRGRVGRRNAGRSNRGVLQTLRIELAPGLAIGGGVGSPFTKPLAPRRTKHF